MNGWKFQDLREPDKASEPVMAETAQYSWVNKLVSNYNAQRTGNLFPAPGPYVMQKGDVPRGAGLSVNVIDHVELDYKVPPGYAQNPRHGFGRLNHGVKDKLGFNI